jgi:hypothetical protein
MTTYDSTLLAISLDAQRRENQQCHGIVGHLIRDSQILPTNKRITIVEEERIFTLHFRIVFTLLPHCAAINSLINRFLVSERYFLRIFFLFESDFSFNLQNVSKNFGLQFYYVRVRSCNPLYESSITHFIACDNLITWTVGGTSIK